MTVRRHGTPPWYDGRPAPLTGCPCAVCRWLRGEPRATARHWPIVYLVLPPKGERP